MCKKIETRNKKGDVYEESLNTRSDALRIVLLV